MNIDTKTTQKGQELIGICSLGNGEWQEVHIYPQEAVKVRHLLVDIRTMPQDHFECMLHDLVKMTTAVEINGDTCSIQSCDKGKTV